MRSRRRLLHEQQQDRAGQRREEHDRQQMISRKKSASWLSCGPQVTNQSEREREHAEEHQERIGLHQPGLHPAQKKLACPRRPPNEFTSPSTTCRSIMRTPTPQSRVTSPEPLTAPSTTLRSNVHRPRPLDEGAADRGRVVQLVDVVLVEEQCVRPGNRAVRRSGPRDARGRSARRPDAGRGDEDRENHQADFGGARHLRFACSGCLPPAACRRRVLPVVAAAIAARRRGSTPPDACAAVS